MVEGGGSPRRPLSRWRPLTAVTPMAWAWWQEQSGWRRAAQTSRQVAAGSSLSRRGRRSSTSWKPARTRSLGEARPRPGSRDPARGDPGSDLAASFDAQLRQGAGERTVDRCDFFVRELFPQTGFGALPRFLRLHFVDAVGRNGEVRQDGHASAGDFDESLARGDEHITALLTHDHFARHQLRHQRDVSWIDPHLAGHAGQGDHLHVLGVHRAGRRDDLQLQRGGGHIASDPSTGFDFIDPALHVEVPFRHRVVLTLQDFLEAAHRIGHRDLLALAPGEHLRHAEWLAQEALDLAGTQHRELVLRRKLVHSENRDDVLEILVALQDLLYSPRDV